jgi:hypothetical protein
MNRLFALLLVLLCVWPSIEYLGVGIANPTVTSAFSGLVDLGYTFTIIRTYVANNRLVGVDPNAWQNHVNANAAYSAEPAKKLKVYGYAELCRNNDPVTQVYDAWNTVGASLAKNGFYLKVQPSNSPACKWESYTHQENYDFLVAAIDELYNNVPRRGYKIGIFSTARIWARFFGTTFNVQADYPNLNLWYANYLTTGVQEPTPSFFDYPAFGGWAAPTFKQIQGNVTVATGFTLAGNVQTVYLDRIYAPII